jgi:RecG-like helicase
VGLKKFVERFTKPIEELDREELRDWCAGHDSVPIGDITLRAPARVVGEVRSVRIVPRAGADALEVTVSDGHASVVAVFLGRRAIAGLTTGRRVLLEGVVTADGPLRQIYNPLYCFL